MKTISEVIGTADLFAEMQQIHEFAAFRNVESRDLTAWFLAYHGDRLVQPGISDMTVPQLARMIVHFVVFQFTCPSRSTTFGRRNLLAHASVSIHVPLAEHDESL